jgi:hypothetical protein
MVRHGLLIVLAAFLFLGGDVTARQNWIAARGEAFLLAALALVFLGSSGHSAASSESPWPQATDVIDKQFLCSAGRAVSPSRPAHIGCVARRGGQD